LIWSRMDLGSWATKPLRRLECGMRSAECGMGDPPSSDFGAASPPAWDFGAADDLVEGWGLTVAREGDEL